MRLQGLIIHHSATKDGSTVDWEAIRKYHTSHRYNGEIISRERFESLKAAGISKGLEAPWAGIGYHVGVERINGKLTTLTGRPLTETGAHTVGKNDHAGLCIVGNFDLAPPDDDLLDYAATTAAAYLRLMGKTIKTMHPHNRFASKSCPGKLFPWEKFYKLVGEKLA